MNGFYANRISPADCINKTLAGSLFPNVSLNVLFNSRSTTMPVDNQTGYCSDVMIPAPLVAGKNAANYGIDETEKHIGQGLKFDLADVETWQPVTIAPYPGNPFYTVKFYGPRFKIPNTYIRLERREQSTNPFENLENVYWQDATDTTWGQDWLGNAMPGGFCYSNIGITEPMNGETYFEDAIVTADPPNPANEIDRSTETSIHENWTPFCTPLPVYNSSGTLVGSFDGLSWIVFFNAAVVKNPLNPPIDAVYDGPPDPPLLDTNKQLLNFEAWIYLTANPSTPGGFKSPRIGVLRQFTYTRELASGSDLNTPFDPYLFFNAGVGSFTWIKIPINFDLLDNANNPTHLTDKTEYIVLSALKFAMGA